jgi:ubiquinone/menaquinone biosynthesis C-methylase UbiE
VHNIIEKAIGSVIGGSVLDVATQEGHFVQMLMENLQGYHQIIGIDIDESAIKTARDSLQQEKIKFMVMNAEKLDFKDESFDTVSISASFHHLSNIQQVLAEMKRVLKPAGKFIIAEMHRDGQTEAELTSIYLHHWVAEVDTALGSLHNHTLARQEFIDYISCLSLSQTEFYDYIDRESDPLEKKRIMQLDDLISRVTQRAETATSYGELKEQGEMLRQRLHKVGAQREPVLVIIGKK